MREITGLGSEKGETLPSPDGEQRERESPEAAGVQRGWGRGTRGQRCLVHRVPEWTQLDPPLEEETFSTIGKGRIVLVAIKKEKKLYLSF